jgi:hypothetical protein
MDVKDNVLELSRVGFETEINLLLWMSRVLRVGFETEISLLLWMSRVLKGCCWRVVVMGLF